MSRAAQPPAIRAPVPGESASNRIATLQQPTIRPAEPTIAVQRPAILIMMGVLFVLALVTTSAILYWFFYVIGALIALSYFWTRAAVNNIHIRRILTNKSATTGDEIREEFYLTNRGRLPILLVELDDHSNLPGYTASVAENLDARQTKRWFSTGTALRRGLFQLGPMTVRTGDPFGIFTAEFGFPQANTFVVYPPISVMPDFHIPAGSQFGSTRSLQRTQQVTSDASGIREYVAGDAYKRIHWLSTARTGRLMSKEFDLEPSAGVWIILDMQRSVHAGSGDESTEEYAAKIASALAYQQIREGKAVGLAALGRDRVLLEPQKGTGQLWKVLENLAIVAAAGATPFQDFLREVAPALGRGMSIVAISPSADAAWPAALLQLGQRGLYPGGILLDAPSFNGAVGETTLQSFSATHGIPIHTVSQGARFDTIRPAGLQPVPGANPEFTLSSGRGLR